MKRFLKRLRNSYRKFKYAILPRYFVATPFLSSLYYLLFSNKFKREQHAVLCGKIKHLNELNKDKSNIYTLIRNTHRLEKGLLMRPKRDVFALDYIEETVDTFAAVWNREKQQTDKQHKWFYDVLTTYFATSGENPVLTKTKKIFDATVNDKGNPGSVGVSDKSTPYIRTEKKKADISFEEFYRLTKYRRSVRWFSDKKVPHDIIDKAILAANQSPSACNRQPFLYRIIDDPKLLQEVSNLPRGIKGYAHGIPMLIVIVGNLDAYFDERDRHIIYIDASLANMALMLALETLGLSSCSINWPDIEELEVQMDQVLRLEKHQRALMCLAVGYPDPKGKVAYSEKRSLNYIRKFN